MMLVTKCPNCHTVFKVVSDQLKISEGWVRCGQCNEIFDTTLNLREWDPAKPEDNIPPSIVTHESAPAWVPSAIESSEAFQAAPSAGDAPTFVHREAEPTTAQFQVEPALARAEPVLDADPIDSSAPEVMSTHAGDDNVSHPSLDSSPTPLIAERRIDPDDVEPDDSLEARSGGFVDNHSFAADLDQRPGPEESLGFLNREKQREATFWDRTIVRQVMVVASLVLALLLVGQFVIQERDRIATYVPSLRSVLDDICQGFGCRVMPLRQIESMTVESSSFNRVRGDTYRLSFVIRNASDLELAKPALELTLTDSQDQAVYRRVLLPAELDPKNATLGRAEEWSESLVISLADGSNPALHGLSKSISGYRLLAFYP